MNYGKDINVTLKKDILMLLFVTKTQLKVGGIGVGYEGSVCQTEFRAGVATGRIIVRDQAPRWRVA